MVESVAPIYPSQIGRVNNLSSGIFNTANGLGEVVGPLFGAAMYETSGFRMTSDMTAVITFLYVFVFIFILNNGIGRLRTRASENLEESKEEDDLLNEKMQNNKKLLDGGKKGDLNSDLLSVGSESLMSHSDRSRKSTVSRRGKKPTTKSYSDDDDDHGDDTVQPHL